MLSDRERESLAEIQRRLAAEDPEFARSFRSHTQRLPSARHRLLYKVIVVVWALLATVMTLAGSPGGALVFTVVAATAGLAQHRKTKHSTDNAS